MSAETLASFVILGRVDDRPTDVCGAWIDSADRICGKPAAEPWLFRRHVTVATKRADAYVAREAGRRECAEANTFEAKRGMAFPTDYVILGNRREQVRMAGNAVTPPAARDLIATVVEALEGAA